MRTIWEKVGPKTMVKKMNGPRGQDWKRYKLKKDQLKTAVVIFALALLAVTKAVADQNSASQFVVISNGDTMWSENEFDQSFFRLKSFIRAGKDTLEYSEVMALKNAKGLYRRTPVDASISGFAKLVKKKGDYEKYTISGYPKILIFQSTFPSSETFYSVSNLELNRINYENVYRDFSRFPESMRNLSAYRKMDMVDHWLMLGGLLVTSGGVYMLENTSPKIAGKTAASIGTGMVLTGLFMWLTKDSYIADAVDSYFDEKK